MARQKRELIWIETPGFTGWGCNLCAWKYQLPKVLATSKAPSIETRCAFLHHRCAPPSEHADVRWNKEIQEWFCTKCGRTSDHIVKGDALVELEQYECGRPVRFILSAMSIPEWKWTQVRARMPADGQTVAIKFMDSNATACYGIGWYNAKEQSWVVTAEPSPYEGVLVPMEWMALPD